jgi:hypothetical protein
MNDQPFAPSRVPAELNPDGSPVEDFAWLRGCLQPAGSLGITRPCAECLAAALLDFDPAEWER